MKFQFIHFCSQYVVYFKYISISNRSGAQPKSHSVLTEPQTQLTTNSVNHMSIYNAPQSHSSSDEDTVSTEDIEESSTNAIGNNHQQDVVTPVLSSTESYSTDDESSMSTMDISSPIVYRRTSLEESIDSTLSEIFYIVDDYVRTGREELRIDLMNLMIILVRLMTEYESDY